MKIDIVVIGISTGGPQALKEILPKFSVNFPVPIIIIQHILKGFSASLADLLDKDSELEVRIAEANERPAAGVVYFAPGDTHLVIRQGLIQYDYGAPENSCRPAADVLFRSVAREYGPRALGVVLTGLGQDGLVGSMLMHKAGADIYAQDEETSMIWGMPGVVVKAEIANKILPLAQVATAIEMRVFQGTGRG